MKILIVSNGPIPVSPNSIIEGGGLRCWGIMQGLLKHGHEAHIAVPSGFFEESTHKAISYGDLGELLNLANSYDCVIYNYASGSNASYLFEKLRTDVLKIADSYVPIHVEVAAREASDLEAEEQSFAVDSKHWNRSLQAADAYLVTSQSQHLYYSGLLSGLGRVTPSTFRELPIIKLPMGCSNDFVRSQRVTKDEEINILWWGGFYPWFDWKNLGDLASHLNESAPNIKITIAGAINPFVTHPAFIENVREAILDLKKIPNVEVIPWVEYGDREKVFSEVDAVMLFNNLSLETSLSWRTRLVDALEFGVPVISNCGDPFADLLYESSSLFKVNGTPVEIGDAIKKELNASLLNQLREGMSSIQNRLTWYETSTELASFLNSEINLTASRNNYVSIKKVNSRDNSNAMKSKPARVSTSSKLWHSSRLKYLRWSFSYLRSYGFVALSRKVASKIFGLTSESSKNPSGMRDVVFLFHQIDRSGAPLIGIDIISELTESIGRKITVVTGPKVEMELKSKLVNQGIDVVVLPTEASIIPLLHGRDVFINSAAVPSKWINEVTDYLDSDHLADGTMFIHENEPGIFLDELLATRIKRQVSVNLKIFVPSIGAKENVLRFFDISDGVMIQNYRVAQAPLFPLADKCDEVRVILVGYTGDFRKRHLDIVLATHIAQKNAKSNQTRRAIKLTLIGVGNDMIGQEVSRMCEELLIPGTYNLYSNLKQPDVLSELSRSNVVVSLSDNESFGLYLAEAMSAGAVVLRTPVSGHHEQVVNGTNGFLIRDGIEDLASRILMLSDIEATSNSSFQEMMKFSMNLIDPFTKGTYSAVVNSLSNLNTIKE
jgi:glycosyltransferase involved in cell wall biosynthesis